MSKPEGLGAQNEECGLHVWDLLPPEVTGPFPLHLQSL